MVRLRAVGLLEQDLSLSPLGFLLNHIHAPGSPNGSSKGPYEDLTLYLTHLGSSSFIQHVTPNTTGHLEAALPVLRHAPCAASLHSIPVQVGPIQAVVRGT